MNNVTDMDGQTGLRIGVNGLSLTPNIKSGVPRHIWEVCKQLDAMWPDAHFYLYLQDGRGISLPSDRWIIREEPSNILRRLKPNLWLKLACKRLIIKDRLSAFWSGTALFPQLPKDLPSCLTVHDLNIRIVPETMPFFVRLAFSLFFESDLRRADAVLAVSRGTAARIREMYGKNVYGIVPNGVGRNFQRASEVEQARVRKKYGLYGRYVLAVGTIEPRKNIMNLLRAFDLLDQRGVLNGCKLVLVGQFGWEKSAARALIAEFRDRWLEILGPVPESDLPGVYSASELLVMPSLYEGFGIPVIEARACGTPVAVTQIPELLEHCGASAIHIHGTKPEDIAQALQAFFQATPVVEAQVQDLPTWEEAGSITKAALCEVMNAAATAASSRD